MGSWFSKTPTAPPPHLMEHAGQILKKSPKRLIEEARKSMGIDCVNYYNVAVCGQSGVGKSSFINGFLSLQDNDACRVGEVETTHHIRSYSNNNWPWLKLWDIPNDSTKPHPTSTYFEEKKLYAFDAILILFCDRFLELDFDILKSANKYGTPCVFVRTKCDIAVKSRAKRDNVTALEASKRFREDVLKSFHEGLGNIGFAGSSPESKPQLFFISNEFFSSASEEQDAYSIYDQKTMSIDSSLSSMDEKRLRDYMVNATKRSA